MSQLFSLRIIIIGAFALAVTGSEAAQTQTDIVDEPDWVPSRRADEQPDIAGMWDNTRALFTPVELPEEIAGQNLSTDELRKRAEAAGQSLIEAGEWRGFENNAGGVGAYGFHWFDWYFDERLDIGQPALVIDPPTGRIPTRTANASKSIAMSTMEQFDSADRMDADDRCISRGPSGMWPTHVNNGKLILQTPGYVVIHSEMIHNTRIIPLGTPHADERVKLWNGDPRGRWEGNTLVVESTNFRNVPHIRGTSPSNPSRQSEKQRITERFTLVSPDLLLYSATMDDANTFTAPWTVAFPFDRKSDYIQFEFACHEGNYAVPTALRGARAEEVQR